MATRPEVKPDVVQQEPISSGPAPERAPERAANAPEPPESSLPPEGQTDSSGQDEAEASLPPRHSLLREDDFAFSACRLELARLGTLYDLAAPVDGGAEDCGIDRPLRVSTIIPGVVLEGEALMRCDTARALAWWLTDFVQPAATRLPGVPRLTGLSLGSTYQCRETIGATTTNLSEHALGNAIDIATFDFDDGTRLPVSATEAGDVAQVFVTAVRWAACLDFATVLGPGSNAAHADHLHLDVKQRRGGYRLCE